MKNTFVASILSFIALLSTFGASLQDGDKNPETSQPATKVENSIEVKFEPVDNMHHFMEYISQPSYKALKAAMSGEAPKDRRGWKVIKSHALILAETSALVAERVPKDATAAEKEEWQELSLKVYESGKQLYKSAGKFDDAKKHYGTMIENCNKCHSSFDGGKHQLKK